MKKGNCLIIIIIIIIIILLNLVLLSNAFAGTCANGDDPPCDEEATFKSVAPNALIVLDLSGSMNWAPAGQKMYVNSSHSCIASGVPHYDTSDATHTKECTISSSGTVPHYSNTSCTGPFYTNSDQSGYTTDCRRLEIAKRAIFSIMDDDSNNTIDTNDSKRLGVQLGFMRFRDGDDTAGHYTSGNIKLVKSFETAYSVIYCNNSTSCGSTVTSCSGTKECVVGESASGGTPLASALREAKTYIDTYKNADNAGSCRLNFVILITDGADTYACSGDGSECQGHMYKRRRDTVAAAKALKDAGYQVFVVGFGSTMPDYLKNTLNWMAYYGGTDNPLGVNSGSSSAFDPTVITSCQTDTATETTSDCGVSTSNFKATNNDPGYLSLSGYAFLASNTDDLTTALRSAMATISAGTYSFTQASIQASRTVDENFLYEASFQNRTGDPFWIGHLKRYKIETDGSIATTADWDAGEVLQNTTASNRSIYTYKSGSLISFVAGSTAATVSASDLGVTTDAFRDAIVNFIRGGELDTSDPYAGWKLGDVFHASPMAIATPNALFYDRWDKSDPKAFATYRSAHERSSANGKRIILIGANDGQLHAFKTGEKSGTTGGGAELWSFIPPNLLSRLVNIAHSTHPTLLTHNYYVDGPINAAEIWLNTGTACSDYTTCTKESTDWHTYFVLSEGRGGKDTLWSSSTSCDSGFSAAYSSGINNYCGYYAFDISDTASAPVYKWRIGGAAGLTATRGSHLGQAWGKMFIGRIRVASEEKWVGLIGGGYSNSDCKGGSTCDPSGKGFYVIDMSNGSILWSATHTETDTVKDVSTDILDDDMNFDLAAAPVAVDADNDGFLDTSYVPDLGGNIWRFRFCTSSSAATCSYGDWTAKLLFSAPSGTIMPFYNSVAVSKDAAGNLWVYAGTGDKTDPTASNAQENFYAIKDDLTSTFTLSDLESIGSETQTGSYGGTKHGWYINFTGHGEKILSEPLVFEGNVYFTSYIPGSTSNPCNSSGTSKVYGVNYVTGAGIFADAAKGQSLGEGMATGVTASRNPTGGTNFYTSLSTGDVHVKDIPNIPNSNSVNNSIIYWMDRRLQ